MADQVDWPKIYIDAGAGDGGVGSEVDPYNEISDINWSTGGDNSVFDYYAGTPTESLSINLNKGDVWREDYNGSVPGTASYPILIQGYGTGDNPILDGSIDISTASYKWTLSQGGTNEYYLEAAAGGDPGISEPTQAFIEETPCTFGDIDIGSLTDHMFEWGHNAADESAPNSKGVYNTVYIRDDTGDPDTEGTLVECTRGANNFIFYLDTAHVTVDGVDCRKSNGHGFRTVANTPNVIIKNLSVYDCYWAGLQIYGGANDCEWNNVDVSGCTGANMNLNGAEGNPVLRLLITGCDSHDSRSRTAGGFTEGSGLKAFRLNESTLTGNKWYNNPSGGIRFDGLTLLYGCDDNLIMGDEFYNNGGVEGGHYAQLEFEFSKNNIVLGNYFHDPWGGGPSIVMSHSITDNNLIIANLVVGSYDNYYQGAITNQTNAGDEAGEENSFIGNVIYGCYRGITISSGHTTILRNNVITGVVAGGYCIQVSEGYDDIDSDYNCVHKGVGNSEFRQLGVWQNYTLAEWRALEGNDTHSIDGDPLMTDPGNDDFTLTSSSPCIRVGDDTLGGYPYDRGLLEGSTWPGGQLIASRDDY